MKLYIPDIGDKLTLIQDWKFNLYHEYRNESLIKAFGFVYDNTYRNNKVENVILPIDTILIVDRIYIRKGRDMADFSSVSLVVHGMIFLGKINIYY